MIRNAHDALAAMASALTITLAALTPLSSANAAQTCSSSIKDSSVKGDISVQGTCSIQGSRIEGNVTIQPGSTLIITHNTLLGSLSGDKVKMLDAQGSNLGKGILITNGVDNVKLTDTSVSGAAIMLSGAKTVELSGSNVGDSMTLKDNSRVLKITDSTVRNGLSCNRGIAFQSIGSNVTGQVNC
ncbi:hypothetical protein G7047_11185 [Diaphorobacter sp. HDW4A]|uniref:hypothetical protein n=1 Tax=Diaphorobacter sp. HDW4A TaxID=2714924 RepID=UPI00140DE32A|nr:hypothetical protein [Diaphorobacter sp. HDW4A]QIL80402.1 hypothetical protein G7047_11185 [Diaphorobacter sp. HDW4A]